MGESVKMWNSLKTHVKVAARACAAATPNWSDGISREGLQWCTIRFDDMSHSVECNVGIGNFMDNPTVATALGLSLKHPLCIEMVPNKFQVDANCWTGELDVFVSQAEFSNEYLYHSHSQEEICGLCYVIPNVVKDYFRFHIAVLNGDTAEGSFFTGMLQTIVRRLTQINAGGNCCVCGLLTSSTSTPGQILWPCAETLICQATYENWRNATAEDKKEYARPTVSSESIPSYEAWQSESVPSVNIRKRESDAYEFEKRGSKKNEAEKSEIVPSVNIRKRESDAYEFEKRRSKKNGAEKSWRRVFRIEHDSYNRRRGWLMNFFSCLRLRFCRSDGRAVNDVGPG